MTQGAVLPSAFLTQFASRIGQRGRAGEGVSHVRKGFRAWITLSLPGCAWAPPCPWKGEGKAGLILAIASLLFVPLPAAAQEARIAVQTETSSLDPHFALVGANQTIAQHLFDALVGFDRNLQPVAGLTAFSNPEPDIWEFRIREGARFHDGTPVTAEDIRFSLERMPRVPNSPAPFVRMQASVIGMEVIDSRTIRLRSRGPDPSVVLNGMTAYIVPAHVARDASTADFNSGRAAIGSGPWRYAGWQPGSHLALARNDDYWGAKPAFARATIRPIANEAARLAALLAGDVDLIDHVPAGDLARLRANAAIAVTSSPSARVIYIGLDQANEVSPFVTARDGGKLASNPLKDARVRKALTLAISRTAIADRVLQGGGHPTGQLAVRGQVGYDPDLALPAYDPALAKRLLAEAGFPDGFRLTLHSPNNRYVEDSKTAQALAQFWTRIGIDARVELMPANVFFTRAASGSSAPS